MSVAVCAEVPRTRLISYAHVTDAHLLALARRRGGRVATFDRGVSLLAEPPQQRDVLLLSRLPEPRGG